MLHPITILVTLNETVDVAHSNEDERSHCEQRIQLVRFFAEQIVRLFAAIAVQFGAACPHLGAMLLQVQDTYSVGTSAYKARPEVEACSWSCR